VHKRISYISIFIILAFLTSACSVKRHVPEGKYLVKKNIIEIDSSKVTFSKSDLSSYISQKPVKGLLGGELKIWFYYATKNKADKKFWKWMRDYFGEEPVYYEKSSANNSSRQIELYLDNVGYFDSKVSNSIATKNSRAKITYKVTPTTPYVINSIDYSIADSILAKYVFKIQNEFPVKVGDIYNAYTFDNQRDLITEQLKENGYYFFSRDYISFIVDSSYRDHSMKVTMKIDNVKDKQSNRLIPHKRYLINNINIFPNYSFIIANKKPIDSTQIKVIVGRKKETNVLNFFFFSKPKIRPQTFSQVVQIQKGTPYSLKRVSQTYSGLNNFKLYTNTNIEFDTVPSISDSIHLLDCKITLQRTDVNSYTVQAEGTKSESDLGIRGSVSYSNKNIFRGAEVFRLSIKGGLEAQQSIGLGTLDQNSKVFNTKELSINGSIYFPRFLSPIPLKKFIREYQPKTNLSVGHSTQIRQIYSRYISSASYSYDWKSRDEIQHVLTPINLNSVKVDLLPEFQAILDAEENQRRKDQYTNHLIFGARYTFTFNNQNINKSKNFIYFKMNLESSGNLLYLFNNTPLITEKDNHHELLGIRYAQYIRGDFEFRQYFQVDDNSWLVFRELAGMGLPYGNSYDMPFERSFYAGGANGMRGWLYRDLGPGAYHSDSSNVERIGDIQLEFNFEYRFPIYNNLYGALFTDIGNIWTYHKNEILPGGEFNFKTFYKQFAIDSGFGFRFNASFVILRLDLALPLRNPYPNDEGNYWRFQDMRFSDIRYVFGIGYPF
jgi:Outer membrane protein/protective antigen OMA87